TARQAFAGRAARVPETHEPGRLRTVQSVRSIPSLRTLTGLLAIVGGLARFAAPAAAQERTLPGRVVDPSDRPVAGLEVFLHRVTDEGAGIVATDTTDAAGQFALGVQGDSGEAIFFVAARWEGQLNIGPMMRSPVPQADYVLRVGVNPI